MTHRIQLRARDTQHFAYSGRCVLVTDLLGHVPQGERFGLFVDNTRVLSRLEWTAGGQPLRPIAASPVGGDAFLSYEELPEGPDVAKESCYLESSSFVGEGLRMVLRFRNYALATMRPSFQLFLAADFADADEAEQGRRLQTAETETTWHDLAHELRIRYCHPQLDRGVNIRVVRSPQPAKANEDGISFDLVLRGRGSEEIELEVQPVFDGTGAGVTERRSFPQVGAPLESLRHELHSQIPRLVSSNATVSKAWEAATSDLASLPYGLAEGPAVPIAGLPLYLQFFGRDSLTIGWQALMATPTILRDALAANAAWQGRRIDDWLDEEPGKMIHQARGGPLSVLKIDPFLRYYGDWATPPDFLIMLGQYLAWTGDTAFVRELLPAAREALDWCERYGDLDRDGFLEYQTRSARGVKNQGWKDSGDAIVDERGRIVDNPIATSELQAYWFAGLQMAAFAFGMTGDIGRAAELLAQAVELKRRFNEAFWMEDLGAYALGLDPQKRQIRSIGSNDGHLMASGIVPAERGDQVSARLMSDDLFSGWGIRTLSASHPAFNPFSYHRGSVWPVEQATIAFGLARYGSWERLQRLAKGTFDATEIFAEHRLPEVIGGVQRDADHPHPGVYPNSCEPQGWSASAIVMLVQSLLSMVAVAPLGLLVVDPHLPDWLPDVRLEGIRVGRASLDIEFRRSARGVSTYRVLRREGRVRVLRQPPPQAMEATIGGRMWYALRSIGTP